MEKNCAIILMLTNYGLLKYDDKMNRFNKGNFAVKTHCYQVWKEKYVTLGI